jgi:hypothetical protein
MKKKKQKTKTKQNKTHRQKLTSNKIEQQPSTQHRFAIPYSQRLAANAGDLVLLERPVHQPDNVGNRTAFAVLHDELNDENGKDEIESTRTNLSS